MARPIKMHEDTLFKVMQKSLKPLEASMSKVSIALQSQSVETKLEGKRAEKITHDNEIKQTSLLNDIATSFKYERKIMQAGWKGMKGLASIGKGIGGFLKDHWGKLGLVGIGTALATMDAKDWMNLISNIQAGLKNIQSAEWWEKQAENMKKFGEKMGGYIMDGVKIWLTGKAVLGLGAAFAKYLAPAIVTALVTKKVLKDAIKKSGLGGKSQDSTKKWTRQTDGKQTDPSFKTKMKNAGKAITKTLKVARWLPVIGLGGAVLGWAAAAATVLAGGNAFKEGFFGTQGEDGKWSQEGKSFGEKVKSMIDTFVTDMSVDLIKKGDTKTAINKTFDKIEAVNDNMMDSVIKFFHKVNWQYNKTTEQMGYDFDKWKTLKKAEWNTWKEKRDFRRGQNEMGGSQQSDFERSSIAGLTTEEKRQRARDGNRKVKTRPVNQEAIDLLARQKAAAGDTGEPGMVDKGLSWFRNNFLSKKPAKTGHRITGAETPTFSSKPIGQVGKNTNMSGVLWNQLSPYGRKGIETSIWSIYNQYGLTPKFTSGIRAKGHPLFNANSKHTGGMAFDLRSIGLGNKKELISAQLRSLFSGNGWGFQDEIAGQRNSTGTVATADHFHIHKAARGYHGMIKQPTGFIVGEAGDERVDITPMNSPNSKMNAMNSLYNERAMSTGSGTSPNITVVSQNSSASAPSTYVMAGSSMRGKTIA